MGIVHSLFQPEDEVETSDDGLVLFGSYREDRSEYGVDGERSKVDVQGVFRFECSWGDGGSIRRRRI